MRIRFEMSFILKISTNFKSPTERTESTEIFFLSFFRVHEGRKCSKENTEQTLSALRASPPLWGERAIRKIFALVTPLTIEGERGWG